MRKKVSVTNEAIVEALGTFNLPIYYGSITEDELESYNFFYYREDILEGNERYLVQTLNIYYVSLNQEDLKELEIIDALKSIRLNFIRAEYDRLQLEGTNNFIDVVNFICTRKMKMVCRNG